MILKIDPKRTAILIIDPQNDVLSEGGAMWNVVAKGVKETKVVEHLVDLKKTAKEVDIPVFYSPHYYTDEEYHKWKHINPVDKTMFDLQMFHKGTWGADFHPQIQPDENTIVLAPHKTMSNFWTGDTNIQFRQRNIQTIVLAGMFANLCVESHLRDAIEHGFDVIVVKDATTGPGAEATQAAYTNYRFIANEVTTTEEINMS
jgi:nicotinamidase-related amidase